MLHILFHISKMTRYTFVSLYSKGNGYKDGSKAYIATPEKIIKEISFTRSTDPNTLDTVVVNESEEFEYGVGVGKLFLDESRKMIIICTNENNMPGSMLFVLTHPTISYTYDIMTIHGGAIRAICQSHNGMYVFTGTYNK